jgi:hypothetical protein
MHDASAPLATDAAIVDVQSGEVYGAELKSWPTRTAKYRGCGASSGFHRARVGVPP